MIAPVPVHCFSISLFYKRFATFAQGTVIKLVNAEQMGLVNILEVGNMSQNFVTFVLGTATILESADSTAGTMNDMLQTSTRIRNIKD